MQTQFLKAQYDLHTAAKDCLVRIKNQDELIAEEKKKDEPSSKSIEFYTARRSRAIIKYHDILKKLVQPIINHGDKLQPNAQPLNMVQVAEQRYNEG